MACSYAQPMSNQEQLRSLLAYAVRANQFNALYPQEKVYLHMDNRSYFIGDTIWFKAYVMNASTLHPTQTSGVLYVELLDENGVEMQHKKLRISAGMCHGEFTIGKNYRTGYYEIRAYTRNMLNFGNIVREHVPGTTLVMQPAIVENYNEVAKNKQSPSVINKREISSSLLAPYNMCAFSRVFPIYKYPEVKGDYKKVMEFYPKHTGLAFSQDINYESRPDNLKITFYPEGGALVVGVPSVVAFEAVDQWGRKHNVDGCLIDEKGTKITSFESIGRGRGTFSLCPEQGQKYYARVTYKGEEYSFELPKANKEGYVLRVTPPIDGGNAMFHVLAPPDTSRELLGWTLQCRGALMAFDTLRVGDNGNSIVMIPSKRLSPGVNQLTLFDVQGGILADRLFFVCPKKQTSTLTLLHQPDSVAPYQEIKLNFKANDLCRFSLSVTDDDDWEDTYDTSNIRSELLLSSDIKGFIEDVDSYFNHSNTRVMVSDIDLLMLVQGWRRYEWKLMSGSNPYKYRYLPEKGLTIDGYVVSGRMSHKKSVFYAENYQHIPNLDVAMSLYEHSPIWKGYTHTDSLGQFSIDVDHLILGEKGLNISLTPIDITNKQLEKASPYIILNRAFSPSAHSYTYYQCHKPSEWNLLDMDLNIDTTKWIDEIIVKKRRKRKSEIFYERPEFTINYYKEWNNIIDRGIPLVLVSQSSYIGRRTGISLDYSLGRVNIPITHLELYTLSGSLKQTYLLPQRIKVYSNLLSRDGILLLDNSTSKMQTLCVAESDLHIITPEKPPYKSQNNMRETYFEGYSQVCSFYSPDYSNCALPDTADYRRTLYWNPDVWTDHQGRASVSFYNNSQTTKLHIRAEGFTRNGEFIVYDNDEGN